MKNVKIIRLVLKNFKGIKSFEAEFNGTTKIRGNNATGKTTLVDAFTWLLFGKDSTGRKDFSIKTLDNNNDVVHHLDHEVEGTFIVDGETVTLKRIYREKWQTKRGTSVPELTSHETVYFWNDVPMKAGEFQQKVDQIILEDTFKMITSPMYFNTLKWQDRRNILIGISGDVRDEDVANSRIDFKALIAGLGKKTIDEFKKELAAKKKKLKEELKLIPARIDELATNTPEAKDWAKIQQDIEKLEQDIDTIDGKLQDSTKISEDFFAKKQKRQREINGIKTKISDIEFDGNRKFQKQMSEKSEAIDKAKTAIKRISDKIKEDAEEIKRLESRINEYSKEQEQLRQDWADVNAREFVMGEGETTCPTCKQQLPAETLEAKKSQLKDNFIQEKNRLLEGIQKDGMAITPRMEEMAAKIKVLRDTNYDESIKEQEEIQRQWEAKHLQSVQSILKDNTEYQELKKQLEAFEAEPESEEAPSVDNSDLKEQKRVLNTTLDGLKKDLGLKDQIEASDKRKNALLALEKKYSGELSELEQNEFTIEEFTRAKVDMLESKINSLFRSVKFKMFDNQLNGGLIETCDTLVNTNGKWVPWPDANTAGRINAGIEIISVLSKHYGTIAPIWIDGAESITSISDTEAQRIELYVSESHKQLEIAS